MVSKQKAIRTQSQYGVIVINEVSEELNERVYELLRKVLEEEGILDQVTVRVTGI